jgi:pilus assembly protein Flp/PilA
MKVLLIFGRSFVKKEMGSLIMIDYVQSFIIRLRNDQRGLTAVEYAVLGGIIVAALVVVGAQFQTGLSGAFTTMFSKVPK